MATTDRITDQAPSPQAPLRLIKFGRVSSKRQLEQSGPQRQLDFEIGQWLESHNAVVVADRPVFTESATVLSRPLFEQAITEAIRWKREGLADAIIVASTDRFARLPWDGEGAIRDCLRQGLDIVFAASNLHASKEEDMSAIQSELNGAWAYVKRLKAQAAYARTARAKAGKLPTASTAWWLHYSKALGRPDGVIPDRGERIRAAALAVIGGRSLRQLEAEFNASGIPAPLGSRWWHSTLREMLHSEALKGVFVYGKTRSVRAKPFEASKRVKGTAEVLFEDKSLGVLSDAEYELLQAALTRNAVNSPRNLTHRYPPCHHHLRCAACDRAFEVNSGKTSLGFRCPKCRTYLAAWPTWRTKVKPYMTRLMTSPPFLEGTARSELVRGQSVDAVKAKLAEKRKALTDVETQTQRAMRLAIALPGHEADVQREIAALDARKATLAQEIAQTEAQISILGQREAASDIVGQMVAQMRDQVVNASDEEWKQVLNTYNILIWVMPDRKTLTFDVIYPLMVEKRIPQEPTYYLTKSGRSAGFMFEGHLIVGDRRVVPTSVPSEVVDRLSSPPPTR